MSSEQDQYHSLQYFDLERDFLAPNRSPSLEAVRPNLQPEESPRPLVPYDTSSSSDESEGESNAVPPRGPKRRRGQTHPSLSDAVLIRSLAPNQPEIALAAGKHALESASSSEAEEGEEDREEVADQGQGQQSASVHSQMRFRPNPVNDTASTLQTKTGPIPLVDSTRPHSYHDGLGLPLAADHPYHPRGPPDVIHEPPNNEGSRSSSDATRRGQSWNILPPIRSLRGPEIIQLDLDIKSEHDDSFVSPTLSKFAISPRGTDHETLTLPALQRSPPPTSQPRSPENKQTLPPITILIDASSGLRSPLLSRNSPGHCSQTPTSYAQSPHPGMSPPAPPVHFNFRSSTRDSSTSGASDYNSSTSAAGSTSASSLVAQSPAASYTSALSMLPERDVLPPQDDVTGLTLSDSEKAAADSGSFSTTSYVCTYHDCTASPFQTQYLLNSHMNVHSNDRPHFCPIENCPRGRNGEGFKRKNEMMRHRLVHTSPGYICPFCTDQQHRYPRPDNLQRHVRVHHVDRSRDDPLLRRVLNQRTDGGSRGRRRRIGTI